MAKVVLIYGPSGSGKTTSLRNFAHDELAFINVNKKPLPFKGKFDSTLETTSYDQVNNGIFSTQKKAIVVDDAGYLITDQYMTKQGQEKNNPFSLFADMAENFYKMVKFAIDKANPEKIVYFVMHEDTNDLGDSKPKTIGKMLDEKVCIEGLITIVLRSERKDGKYIFHTQTNGFDKAKSPLGMFDSEEVDNDLKAIDKIIREYYDMDPLETPLKKGEK